MTGILNALLGFIRSAAAALDPYFNQVVLLLHGDGNQGPANLYNENPPAYLAFADNSSNNFPITVNGDAYGTNISPYQGNYSNFFDGTGDSLSIANAAALDLDANFTIEAWIYPTSLPNAYNTIIITSNNSTDAGGIGIWATSAGEINVYGLVTNSNIIPDTSGFGLTVNQWTHIAVTRSGSTVTLYKNGVSFTTGTSSSNFNSSTPTVIGNSTAANQGFFGYISNLRVVKGTAVYTSNFTPPTTPLTAISGTSLLTCQSNRFIDNSSNNFTITVNGDTLISPFQPFTLAANTSGAGYFDGTGDWLLIPSTPSLDMGTGPVTIECWLYITAVIQNYRTIISDVTGGNNYINLRDGGTGGRVEILLNGSTILLFNLNNSIRQKAWAHFAVVRSGNTFTVYVNGVSLGTNTSSVTWNLSNGGTFIGRWGGATPYEWPGYISDMRIVKGTAVYTSNFTPPTAPVANITNTSLLTCQYSGTVNNTGFIDSGPYYFPITKFGNTTQGTFSPFSLAAGQWSNYFDGVSENLSVPNNAAFQFGTGDFTVEAWVYILAYTDYGVIVKCATDSSWSAGWALSLGSVAGGLIEFYVNGNAVSQASRPPLNSWSHVAVSRSGTSLRIFINGALIQTVTNSGSLVQTTALTIGADITNTNFEFNGYISNVRVVKGTAVYTSAFTPPTAPLTAITNTSLLTCQSNRFVDNSTNNFTITRNGDVRVTPFSPFAPTAAYDPAVNGGSGYFDGSGSTFPDYLRLNNAVGIANNAFTIGFWFYPLNNSVIGLFDSGPNVANCFRNYPANSIQDQNDGTVSFSGSYNVNAWNWMCITKSGTSFTVYINGVTIGSATCSSVMTETTFTVGAINSGGDGTFLGYISNFIVINNAATILSVPTSPLTAVSGTSLLLNFTSAGIFDQTGKNVLETVGNAQVDTNVKKYGIGSMKFDGTGDYLLNITAGDPASNFGSGNFTIEMFVYHNQLKNYSGLIGDPNTIAIYTYTNGTVGVNLLLGSGQAMASSGGVALTNTWQHYALVRNGTVTTLYVDGTSRATFTSSGVMQLGQAGGFRIGSVNTWGDLNGYIDDLRVTKGVARYTANFTPPTQAFPNQ